MTRFGTIAAALLVSAALAGCGEGGGVMQIGGATPGGTDYGDEEFTIVLLIFHGTNHVEAADYFKKLAEERRDALKAGKLHPFTGPLKDQSGKEFLAAGKTYSDGELKQMNFYVEGVEGAVPK